VFLVLQSKRQPAPARDARSPGVAVEPGAYLAACVQRASRR
jgi:hypothetical protein